MRLFTQHTAPLLLVALSACSSNAPDNSDDNPPVDGIPSADTSAIAGLWDASFDHGSDGRNTRYIEISDDAKWTYYDYQGDAVNSANGNSQNCYTVTETNVSSLGNAQYQVGHTRTEEEVSMGIESAIIFTIVKSDNTLSVMATDSIDFNNDGSTSDIIDTSWPALSAIDPEFIECAPIENNNETNDETGTEGPTGDNPAIDSPTTDTPVASGIPSADTSAIAGFWDASFDQGSDGRNTLYIEISNDAVWRYYDYQGDVANLANGNSQFCYMVTETNVSSLGNDQYQVGHSRTEQEVSMGIESAIIFTITKSDSALSVLATDTIDFNNDGSTSDLIDTSWPALSTIELELTNCNQ